jgi:hypothetical protein
MTAQLPVNMKPSQNRDFSAGFLPFFLVHVRNTPNLRAPRRSNPPSPVNNLRITVHNMNPPRLNLEAAPAWDLSPAAA